MTDHLNSTERRCCHMAMQEHDCSNHTLEDWRREFRKIPRSEHCRDCPVAKTIG